MTDEAPDHDLTFLKGGKHYRGGTPDASGRSPLDIAKSDFNEVLSSKNLTFLFGAGCSSQISEKKEEQGIPTMGPMAQGLLAEDNTDIATEYGLTAEIKDSLTTGLGIDLSSEEYAWNLERLMEVLFGFQFALDQTDNPSLIEAKKTVDSTIDSIKKYVFDTCNKGQRKSSAANVLKLYQTFYRKLSQRSRSLPRPTVATTNYDLFNEIAMDRVGIPYINGFLGSIEKRFNPASFRYTIAQRLDLTSQRWTSLDNLVYFLKLHGSLNWHAVDAGLFPVEERPISESGDGNAMLIYPTPAKQNASFAAPYSDIFREFQTKVVQEQSVLVTIGYGFGDEHVNNIIYQALTIPTFRLLVFAKPEFEPSTSNKHVRMLQELNDPRVWIIGTEKSNATWKAHYFKEFVEDIMPVGDLDPAEKAIENVMGMFTNIKKDDNDGD
ncbi:SIR2 family protein [Corynebacterium sp. P7202]|uniref:SIR2 family protein n=1 Tax=Corynebacterium pygosceleis TaxID=2800406 RepID=A0A9Q4GHU8_9CORY|nr:SIR2 family protein [Corynebacterium pygosceleis]MCK7636758.1 SIR2 family protein [Corynebacterium pygosceleis]MCX7467511.1 SIR2 family protein [Corynebacterium pygosceleis]